MLRLLAAALLGALLAGGVTFFFGQRATSAAEAATHQANLARERTQDTLRGVSAELEAAQQALAAAQATQRETVNTLGEERRALRQTRDALAERETALRNAETARATLTESQAELRDRVERYRREVLALSERPDPAELERRVAELQAELAAARRQPTATGSGSGPSGPTTLATTIISLSDDRSVLALDRGSRAGLRVGQTIALASLTGQNAELTLTEVREGFAIGRLNAPDGFRSTLVKGGQLRLITSL